MQKIRVLLFLFLLLRLLFLSFTPSYPFSPSSSSPEQWTLNAGQKLWHIKQSRGGGAERLLHLDALNVFGGKQRSPSCQSMG